MIKPLNTLNDGYLIKPVFDTVLTANTTNITIPLTSGSGWRLEFALQAVGVGDMSMLFGSDTLEAGYQSTNLAGTQTGNRAYLAYANAASDIIHGSADIKVGQGKASYVSRTIRISGATVTNIGMVVTKNSTITQLTSLYITSPVSNMYVAGSWLRLYNVC